MFKIIKKDYKWFWITSATIIFTVVVLAFFYTDIFNRDNAAVVNYDECAARGYQTMEMFPPKCKTPDGQTFVQLIDNSLEKEDLIRLEYPVSEQIITSSPILLQGQARGNWFFEASFPVEIMDMNGNLLHIGIATAQNENWMTTNFVPFTASLELENDFQGPALIVLHKHNPSDYRELDDALMVPIRINIARDRAAVRLYFGETSLADTFNDCGLVSPVIRHIPQTQAIARAAILELLEGPTFLEKHNGFYTSINPGITLNRIAIVDGEAQVDFSNQLDIGVAGSCRVTQIRAQITETLNQFPSVNRVTISIGGRTEDILQP